ERLEFALHALDDFNGEALVATQVDAHLALDVGQLFLQTLDDWGQIGPALFERFAVSAERIARLALIVLVDTDPEGALLNRRQLVLGRRRVDRREYPRLH